MRNLFVKYGCCLIVIFSSFLNPRAWAQDAPAVELGDSPQEEKSVSIEVIDEPDGDYLSPESLRGILRQADSQARVEWDSPAGALRIYASGRQMQAILKEAILDIDGTTRKVDAPLRMKSSGVIVPMSTARVMLAALNLQLDIAEDAGPDSSAAAGVITMRTQDDPAGGSANPKWEPTAATASTGALPELVLPASIAGDTGLSWSQLGDARHAKAPQKILITFDKELDGFASEMRIALMQAVRLDPQLMSLSGPRNDPRLVAQVVGQYPDLHVDLMLSPTASAEGTGSGRATWGIEIWTVHDALWPGDRGHEGDDQQATALPYHLHQYHNLALGSLVRGELSATFPGRSVILDLSPAYLLRRMNAPCIAILIPPALLQERGIASSSAASAAAMGITRYVRGMQAVTGTR